VRSSSAGSALLVRGIDQGDERELLAAGAVIDVASPRFSPSGEVIAFAVATPFAGRGLSLLERVFDVRVAEAHGLPWDVWLVSADGSNPHQLAPLGADDPSLAWSPDGRQLFAYGGTGSFLIDVASGETERLPYLVGYGAVAWVP
jgi:Tol biopolymer transport system component